MMVKLTRTQIEEALPRCARGLEQYLWLQDRLDSTDVLRDSEYRRRFNGFYRVRRAPEWQETFYGLLQRKKAGQITFGQVLSALHRATGRCEASFASKLVATIRPDMPVIDSVVVKNLGLRLPRYNAPHRFAKLDRLHDTLRSMFRAFLRTQTGRHLVKRFRTEYRAADISEVKMLDLVLWQTRPNNALHPTAALGCEGPFMDARTMNFSPAGPGELIVHGSQKPDTSPEHVSAWVRFMRRQGIARVCCLLDTMQLQSYRPSLESQCAAHFGNANVCIASITDYHLAERRLLHSRILPFLRESDVSKQPAVVHCWSGNGRTGHVLAAWLVAARGLDPMEAITTVEATGRKPREAITHGKATLEELLELLRSCAAGSAA